MENMNNQGGCFIRGTCKYCGQYRIVSFSDTQEEANEKASEECDCGGTRKAKALQERKEKAMNGVESVFGEGASDAGYVPVSAEVLGFLKTVVTTMAEETVGAVSVEIPGACRAKFSFTGKGNIKICRSETRTRSLES